MEELLDIKGGSIVHWEKLRQDSENHKKILKSKYHKKGPKQSQHFYPWVEEIQTQQTSTNGRPWL